MLDRRGRLRPDVTQELLAWLRTCEVPDADEGGVLAILRERTFARPGIGLPAGRERWV